AGTGRAAAWGPAEGGRPGGRTARGGGGRCRWCSRGPTLSGPMTASLLALSLSNTFTEAGAVAAFVALIGIAILSLLSFAQARELRRLRDWAGRAPERAAELEQRVSASASARVQQSPPLIHASRIP